MARSDRYLSTFGKVGARCSFFYGSGKYPSAVRDKNWKIYFTMVSDAPQGFLPARFLSLGPVRHISDTVRDLDRFTYKTLMGLGGILAPLLPPTSTTGTCCPSAGAWLKELESYPAYPPLQDPASYNLDEVRRQIKQAKTAVAATSSTTPTRPAPSVAPVDELPAHEHHGRCGAQFQCTEQT